MPDLSPLGARRIYRIMCNVAGCGGSIAPSEQAVLDAAAERYGINAEEAATLLAEGLGQGKLEIGEDPLEREALIAAMIDVAAADGRLDRAESKRLVQAAKEIGLSRDDLEAQLIPRLTGGPR